MIDRAEEHLGTERAERYLRKFYPWYIERLEAPPALADELQRSADLARARELVGVSRRARRALLRSCLIAGFTPSL